MFALSKEEVRLHQIEANESLSLQGKIAMYLCGLTPCDHHMHQAQDILDIIQQHQKESQ